MSTRQAARSRNLKGKEALLEWCKQQTYGYKGVSVRNLNSSWRDGLAFCALLHRFDPELIKFDDLSKEDALKNNELAFKVAEEKLKVPALLEASDLVSMEEIDEMSVMTYLSMLYKRIKKNSSPAPRSPAVNSTTGISNKENPFDVLKDENNFTERFEKRKHRLSSGEKDNFSNRSVPKETTLRELHQENHV
ncbi:unnamed protein product [Pocillopora meandrina]|uniref:Calponin-homology (CH) domain-containing protein n=1 Tax=Pocillopora meandrina TaxID=46732 RepID=A0AAU9WZ80_9CNID|nr:unnamed protein product [Pocillopora meandrina]